MRKIILLLVTILLITNLFCLSNFSCIFTMFNPSSSDMTFGLDSGTANIWNTSPLSTWSNPAKLGYHNNFSFGYTHFSYFKNIFDDMHFRSSYISYGWNGLGILLPAPSAKRYLGTVMSYGKQEYTDNQGNILGSFDTYDASSKIALGINTLEFVNNFLKSEQIKKMLIYGDVSFGFNVDFINSYLIINENDNHEVKLTRTEAFSSGFGFISRFSPFNRTNRLFRYFKTDITLGIYFLNPVKTKIKYDDDSSPLPYGTRSAFAGKFSIDLSIIPDLEIDILGDFTEDLFSVYYSQDRTQSIDTEEYYNPGTWGEGIEYTLLNIFSIRKGFYIDTASEMVGSVNGYGINIEYKDIFQFQFNKAEYNFNSILGKQEQSDYLFRINLVKCYSLLME